MAGEGTKARVGGAASVAGGGRRERATGALRGGDGKGDGTGGEGSMGGGGGSD